MPDLIPIVPAILENQTKPGVSARKLYQFLELNPTAWARWAKKNIVQNPYAVEHLDWEGFLPDVENRTDTSAGGRPTQDYALSMDFAKKLAMMARSEKGEEARQWFLQCERVATQQASLPVVHDRRTQIAIEMLVRLDDAEHRLQLLEEENRQKTAQLQRAEEKADLALADAHHMTVKEFICKNGLLAQFPPPRHKSIGTWLGNFCQHYGLPVRKDPVVGEHWTEENSYPIQAFMIWLRAEQTKPKQLTIVK